MRVYRIGMVILLGCAGTNAAAKDDKACPTGLVCASAPATVVKALHDAGYKAKLTVDKVGDPMIETSAAGYDFEVMFYGCEEKRQCDSLQFYHGFEAGTENTAAYANK